MSGHPVSDGVGDPRIVGVDVDVLRDVSVKLLVEVFIDLDRMRVVVMCRGASAGVCKCFLLRAGCFNCLRLYGIEARHPG